MKVSITIVLAHSTRQDAKTSMETNFDVIVTLFNFTVLSETALRSIERWVESKLVPLHVFPGAIVCIEGENTT